MKLDTRIIDVNIKKYDIKQGSFLLQIKIRETNTNKNFQIKKLNSQLWTKRLDWAKEYRRTDVVVNKTIKCESNNYEEKVKEFLDTYNLKERYPLIIKDINQKISTKVQTK